MDRADKRENGFVIVDLELSLSILAISRYGTLEQQVTHDLNKKHLGDFLVPHNPKNREPYAEVQDKRSKAHRTIQQIRAEIETTA